MIETIGNKSFEFLIQKSSLPFSLCIFDSEQTFSFLKVSLNANFVPLFNFMILIEMFTSWNCIRWSNVQWTWGVTFPSAFSLLLFSIFLTSVQSFFYLPSEFSYFLSPFFYFPSPFCLLPFTIFFTSFHTFFFTSLHHYLLPFSFLKPFYFPSALLYFQQSYKTVARKRSSQNFPKLNILSTCLFLENFSCFVFLHSAFWSSLFCLIILVVHWAIRENSENIEPYNNDDGMLIDR